MGTEGTEATGLDGAERQVIEQVSLFLGVPSGELNLELSLGGYGIDSLKGIELLFAIEQHFVIQLAPDEFAGITTLGGLVRHVAKLVEKRASAERGANP